MKQHLKDICINFKGHHHTKETRNKIRIKQLGVKESEEFKRKCSIRMTGAGNPKAKSNNPEKYKIVKCKYCEKEKEVYYKSKRDKFCSKDCYYNWQRINHIAPAIKDVETWRKNIGFGHIGIKNKNPYGLGKQGYREDIGIFVRSSWEANIIRILIFLNILWEYEKHRVYLLDKESKTGRSSFIIDLWLPQFEFNIEIKGARFGNKDKKLKLLYEQYPDFPIKIIDGEVYHKLEKMFKHKIPSWE